MSLIVICPKSGTNFKDYYCYVNVTFIVLTLAVYKNSNLIVTHEIESESITGFYNELITETK